MGARCAPRKDGSPDKSGAQLHIDVDGSVKDEPIRVDVEGWSINAGSLSGGCQLLRRS